MSGARAYVTIVSGLPRSGTSLVMQMLAAGGMRVLADDARAADADNPRGYFELAAAKAIARDAGFVAGALGQAVKIVVPLLRHLPATPPARVLLIERDLGEVIASQERMLARAGSGEAAALEPERLAAIYAAQLAAARAQLASRPETGVLPVAHADLLRDPAGVAAAIEEFLDGGLDRAAMAAAVDPALHRQRPETRPSPERSKPTRPLPP